MNLPDSARRGLRTFVQAFVGVVILQAGAIVTDANDGSIDANLWRRVGVTALVAGIIAITSYVQNALEDSGAVPSVLKSHASDGANPITTDPAV